MAKTHPKPLATHFLVVDLDVISRERIDPLVEALGDRVVVLYAGRWGRRYSAHFELAGYRQQPQAEREIRRFLDLIDRLPRTARRLWREADTREFNIGIQAAVRSQAFELRLRRDTLAELARVNGQLLVTVYAPHRLPRSTTKQPKRRLAA